MSQEHTDSETPVAYVLRAGGGSPSATAYVPGFGYWQPGVARQVAELGVTPEAFALLVDELSLPLEPLGPAPEAPARRGRSRTKPTGEDA